jgi:3-phenylpropionate/cinnamic acid dioxygenase small subunit
MSGALGADDRWDVADLLNRYADAVDGRDWKGLAALFTPAAVADYGELGGVQRGPEAIVAHCADALARYSATQHLIGNVSVRVTASDSAASTCSFLAVHLRSAGRPPFVVGGRYADELTRTCAGWRIRRRSMRTVWHGTDVLTAVEVST